MSRAPGRAAPAIRGAGAALGLYLLASVAMFGLPVLDDPAREIVSVGTSPDPGAYVWALEWWPHAISQGLNPFRTDLLFVPDGANLAKAAFVPGAALALWPVTELFGPVVSYNVAMVLSPALSAFTAFLLCRHVTGAFWPSLAGGWLFGWSAYLLGHLVGHLNLVAVFLVPVVALLVLMRLDGDLRPRAFTLLLAGALTGQLLLSTEVLLTLTLFGAAALAAAWWLAPSARRAGIVRALGPIAAAYALMALVTAPYLYYALKGGGPEVDLERARRFSNDLLAFAFPTEYQRLGRRHFHELSTRFTAGAVEGGAYLGAPLLAMVAAFALSAWHRRSTRLLLLVAGITALLSLGSRLHVAGASTMPMPWAAFDGLPLLGGALPARFVMYTALAVSVMAALWLASPAPRPAWRIGLALAAVAFLFPNLSGDYWRGRPHVPAFFADGLHARHLDRDDVVALLPLGIGGNSMLWHAEAGFGFRLAGGYVGDEFPASYREDPLYGTLAFFGPTPDMVANARRFLDDHEVDAVVLAEGHAGPWPAILGRLGLTPQRVGGVLLYRVDQAGARAPP